MIDKRVLKRMLFLSIDDKNDDSDKDSTEHQEGVNDGRNYQSSNNSFYSDKSTIIEKGL